MPENYDISALGELLIDFTPSGNSETGLPLFTQNPGGGPANMLAMYAKLAGAGKAALISKVGNDGFGDFLEKQLMSAGISTAGLVKSGDVNTTLAFVHLFESGERSFSFYRKHCADLTLEFSEVKKSCVENCAVFHLSGLSLCAEPARNAAQESLKLAKSLGKLTSFDPNWRPPLWENALSAKRESDFVFPLIDILKVSEEEMTLFTGETELVNGAACLAAKGPAVVFVSMGAQGAFYYCVNGNGKLPAYTALKTIDTTGAGDAFLGAALWKLHGKNRSELEKISTDELSAIVNFANAAGSLSTTKKGGIPSMPELREVESLIKN